MNLLLCSKVFDQVELKVYISDSSDRPVYYASAVNQENAETYFCNTDSSEPLHQVEVDIYFQALENLKGFSEMKKFIMKNELDYVKKMIKQYREYFQKNSKQLNRAA